MSCEAGFPVDALLAVLALTHVLQVRCQLLQQVLGCPGPGW